MKKLVMLLCCLTVSLSLTGCGMTKELKDAYKKMSIGEKESEINGYTMSIRLFGIYNDKKVSTSVRVNNYMDKDYKVSIDDVTYYLVDGAKYKVTEDINDHFLSQDRYSYEITDEEGNTTYSEIDEDIPFTNTDDFLATLKNVKADDKPLTEKIGEEEYQTYTYLASKKTMSKLLKDTELKDAKIEKNVPAKVWIDNEGYVYKIEYDLAASIEDTTNLTLNVYCSGINSAREIYLDVQSREDIGVEQ